MTDKLSVITDFLARKKVVIFTLILTAALILIINRIDTQLSGAGGLDLLFLQIAFTSRDFDTVLSSWGPDGIGYYVRTIWIDYFYALSAAFLLVSATAYFREQGRLLDEGKSTGRDAYIYILPMAYAVMEMAENTLHVLIIMTKVSREPAVLVSSMVSILKYLFLLISIALMMRFYLKFRDRLKTQGLR